jgi:hypothetical protein
VYQVESQGLNGENVPSTYTLFLLSYNAMNSSVQKKKKRKKEAGEE